jgi:long-chain acyl-CoA synthetase
MDLNNLLQKLRTSTSNGIEYYEKGKKHRKNFSQVHDDVAKVACYLRSLGLKPGSRVGILGKNSYEWILIDLACTLQGIITLPLDPGAKSDLDEVLSDFELGYIFCSIREYNGKSAAVIPFTTVFNSSAQAQASIEPYTYSGDDVFTVISTSGTSGKSKSIEIKKKSFDSLVKHSQDMYNFRSDDRFLVFLPLHVYLERCYVYAAILLDFDVIITSIELVFHSIRNDKPTVIIGIPYFFENVQRMFMQKINEKLVYKLFFRSYLGLKKAGLGFLFGNKFSPFVKLWGGGIRYLLTGSAPIKRSVLEFYRNMGIILYEGYGMSEIGGMVALNAPGAVKLGSVGKPFPGKKVFFDKEGQIFVQSDDNANTTYYKSTREQNESTYLPGGVVATGDLGYLDKDGFLFIKGRSKDLIILSTGKKIHPQRVEERLENSGLFQGSLVYGNDKPFLVALLSCNGGPALNVKEVLDKLNDNIPDEEKIRQVHIIHEKFTIENGMLTPTLKVNRKGIIQKYEKELESLYN